MASSSHWQARTFALALGRTTIHFDFRPGTVRGRSGLVFLPGWCCPRSDCMAVAQEISGYPAVVVDLPGQGDSTTDKTDWSIADFASSVVAVVRSLGWDDVVLVGHSMGGAIAVEAAATLGGLVRHIVCVDSLTYEAFYSRQDATAIGAALQPFESDYAAAMLRLVQGYFVDRSNRTLVERVAGSMAKTPQAHALGSMRGLLEWDRDEALSRTSASITVLSESAFLDPTVARMLEGRMRIERLDLGGHFYLIERPQETAQSIEVVLQRLALHGKDLVDGTSERSRIR